MPSGNCLSSKIETNFSQVLGSKLCHGTEFNSLPLTFRPINTPGCRHLAGVSNDRAWGTRGVSGDFPCGSVTTPTQAASRIAIPADPGDVLRLGGGRRSDSLTRVVSTRRAVAPPPPWPRRPAWGSTPALKSSVVAAQARAGEVAVDVELGSSSSSGD